MTKRGRVLAVAADEPLPSLPSHERTDYPGAIPRNETDDAPPLPGFEAVNDLGIGIRREQMHELREASAEIIAAARVLRDRKSRLCLAADRLEAAIQAIPGTS